MRAGTRIRVVEVVCVDELTREELISIILELRERVAALEKENAELRAKLGMGGGSKGPTPEWVKPNRAERRAARFGERKKRKHSFARRRDKVTRQVLHAVESCPDCGRRLIGGWVSSTRQTIEIPETPIEIIEHVMITRRCGVCDKNHTPKLTVADGVIGKQRVGIRLMSLVATLAIAKRMPQRAIQKLLGGLYGVHISLGEITEILHKVAGFARGALREILREVRGSPVTHADETGWREDGINGYLWSLSTKKSRYFHFDISRAGAVARKLLGFCFGGVLVCDFYAGYNWYCGPVQRCWVHLLRDLKKLVEAHPDSEDVSEWVESVTGLYRVAKKIARRGFIESVRVGLRGQLEARLLFITEPYLKNESAPQRVLAERIERHLGELLHLSSIPAAPPATIRQNER